jgi:leader peptidase (prepilin peptidase)/N-methyltransferase
MGRVAAVIFSAFAGLAFGSFGNVVIYRVPRKESVVRPASHCPSCDTPLGMRENIPLYSWIVQRGRCRHCRAQIPPRYLFVEALTAGLFGLTALSVDRRTDLIAFLPLVWVLVVLSFIDLEHKKLPNRIVLPATVVEMGLLLVAALLGPGLHAWTRALVAGAGAFAFFFALALIAPAGMGMGDVKLSAMLGMALGYLGPWQRVVIGFFAAFLLGAVVGVVLMAARRAGRKSQIPFGPYMAAGTLIGIFWGAPLVRALTRG